MSLDPFFHFKNKIDRVIWACSIFYLKRRSPLYYGPHLSHRVFLLFRHTQRSCPLLNFLYLVVPVVTRIAHVPNIFSLQNLRIFAAVVPIILAIM